jgi:predicted small metal-binding protein
MAAKLEKIECDPSCGFLVRSHDRIELISLVKSHVKKQHGKDVSDDDLTSMITVV